MRHAVFGRGGGDRDEILEMRGEDEVAVATRQRVGRMPQLIV